MLEMPSILNAGSRLGKQAHLQWNERWIFYMLLHASHTNSIFSTVHSVESAGTLVDHSNYLRCFFAAYFLLFLSFFGPIRELESLRT